MPGPKLAFSETLHAYKHRLPGETFDQSAHRISRALSDDRGHEDRLYDAVVNQRFLFAGRIQAAVGSSKSVTPYNCFVSGTIHDSFVHDGDASIMGRAAQAAATMRMGGGIGYDFSTLRPAGSIIHGVQATTDGPMAFLPIFDAVCQATSSAGNRRGAQMGVMRIDHPDIRRFITAKQGTGKLTGFNLSVAVTDEFMYALADDAPFELRFKGQSYETVSATELWDEIMASTWDYAEPGVLFIDTINRMNNLYYCETIKATNPCGEQPLPDHAACLLGSFNLVKYLYADVDDRWSFDWSLLEDDIDVVVRAMDNVIDTALYPLPEQRSEAMNKRRMGLGVTGLANAIEAMGYAYGTRTFLAIEARILTVIRDRAYMASAMIASRKEPFPLFDSAYLKAPFIKSLPSDVRDAIARYGIRNSHLTSIAPTGTISFTADYVSASIEPVVAYEAKRVVNMPGGPVTVDVSDYAYRELNTRGKLADQVTADEHVAVLTTAASLVDSSVSKTCNVDGSMEWEDFKGIYQRVWENGGKGCTTFNKDGKLMGILAAKEPVATSCEWDPATGRKSCE